MPIKKHREQKHPFLLEDQAQWFAIHTKYKCEKMVVKLLAQKGVEAYAPLQQQARIRSGKVKYVEIPLITCYVFVHIVRSQYVSVLGTQHVSAFIKSTGEIMPIPEASIEMMRRIVMDKDLQVTADYSSFQKGDSVTINSGSLAGIAGKIIKKEDKRYFQVQVENLGYDLLILVDGSFLNRTGIGG